MEPENTPLEKERNIYYFFVPQLVFGGVSSSKLT